MALDATRQDLIMRSPLFLFATGFALIAAALGVWWYLQSGHGGNGIDGIRAHRA